MASSGKGKGSVKTVEWWKHLRDRKRAQNRLVREDGKEQIEIELEETDDKRNYRRTNQEDYREASWGEIIKIPFFRRERLNPLHWKLMISFCKSKSSGPIQHLDAS